MLQFGRFAFVRAVMAIITLVIVSLIVFSLMELVPGDCAERYLAFKNTQGSSIQIANALEAERVRLGLDQPFLFRWGSWIVNAFQGEFGDSCILRVNIAQLLGDKFWLSLGLCLASLLLAYVIAIPVGIISRRNECSGAEQRVASVQLPRPGAAELPAGADDHAGRDSVFGETLTGLFSNEFRDAPWSGAKFVDLSETRLAADLHPWLVGDGLCAANCAGADVG